VSSTTIASPGHSTASGTAGDQHFNQTNVRGESGHARKQAKEMQIKQPPLLTLEKGAQSKSMNGHFKEDTERASEPS
jgi:hypothetical protein